MKRFTNIDHIARLHLDISLSEYCIADSIFNLKSSELSPVKGWCSRSQKDIGAFLGFDRTTVNRSLKKLQEKGIVEKQEPGLLRTTKIWDEAHTLTEDEQAHVVASRDRKVAKCDRDAVASRDRHLYTQSNNTNSTQTEIEIYPTFNDFWDAGLPKTDKKRAEGYWKKIKQKDREAIMEHLPLYVQSNKKEFLKGAATYLYNETWKDEIINRNQKDGVVDRGVTASGTEQRIRQYFAEERQASNE